MHIESLTLANFRNIYSLSVEFSPFLNILWGQNGQGKTNILESLYLLATSRSFRAAHDQELISWHQSSSHVDALISCSNRKLRIEADLFIPQLHGRLKKQFRINSSPITRFSKLIGLAPMVLFTPHDLEIVRGAPALRRNYLDFILSQTSTYYLDSLQRYNTALEQRNSLLREKGSAINKMELSPWNEQLVATGSIILNRRMNLIQKLFPLIEDISTILSNKKEKVSICYHSSIQLPEIELSIEQISELFNKELHRRQTEEMDRRQSLVGPHRDDLLIVLNGYPVRTFASQGQQRSTAIALKFAEWHYINNVMETPPVLLLDDLFSELDKSRSDALLELVKKAGQAFITSTENSCPQCEHLDLPVSWFKIVEGRSYVLTA